MSDHEASGSRPTKLGLLLLVATMFTAIEGSVINHVADVKVKQHNNYKYLVN